MNAKKVTQGIIETCVFALGALGGVIVMALLFPGNVPLQIAGIILGESIAVVGMARVRLPPVKLKATVVEVEDVQKEVKS